MKIFLGPAGSPGGKTLGAMKIVRELGLHSMELAFGHGVTMGNETAKEVGRENKKHGVRISIHAPYYINLNSSDRKKVEDSKKRILDTCERAHHIGAKKVVFHSGYYHDDRKKAYGSICAGIAEVIDAIKRNRWDVELLPETAGRVKQFGDLDEIIQISRETGCSFCVDPAHIFARNNGKIDYEEMFDRLKETKEKDLHFHFSGVAYSEKGEKHHLTLGDGGPDFKAFAEELIARKRGATIISESPVTWKDSLAMKKILENLGHSFDR